MSPQEPFGAGSSTGAEPSPETNLSIWRCWQGYEWGLLVVGFSASLLLMCSAGPRHLTTWEALAAVVFFGACVEWCRRRWQRSLWQRLRLFASYGFALWYFGAVARIIPAWGRIPLDASLLGIDRWLFGETPAALWPLAPWLTVCMSGAYLSYLVYLHIALLTYGWGPLPRARMAWTYVFMAYSIGFLGYLCVPAVGPQAAYPSLFPGSLPGMEHWLSQLNHRIVSNGSGVYDVFPSLHVLITCVLLHVDWTYQRRRFWMVLPLGLPLVASTLYLRYHYAIDLIAGFACFIALAIWFQWHKASGLSHSPQKPQK